MKKISLMLSFALASFGLFAQTPQEILEKHIAATGGRDAISKITDETATMTGEVQGASIEIVSKKKTGNKSLQTVTVSGMGEMSKAVCDGTKAKAIAQGNEVAVEGAMLKFSILQAGISPESNYTSAGVKMTLSGKDKVNGKDAHKIECDLDGQKWTELFDVESGLRVQMIQTQEGPMGQVTATLTYSDYKEVNGVKVAHKVSNDMGMFMIELEIKTEFNKGIPDSEFEIK